MYFGVYQISTRHPELNALPYEAPCAGPSLLTMIRALLRRLFH